MNPNNQNREDIPPKPINRVAVPIRVDEFGNRIENTPPPSPAPVMEPNIINDEPKKIHDSSTIIFILVLLIILAILVAFIFYVIVPRFEKGKTLQYNDKTSEVLEQTYQIQSISINQNMDILNNGQFIIDDHFTLKTSLQGTQLGVYINDVFVTNTLRVLSTVGRVDDLLLLTLEDAQTRGTRLIAIEKSGNKVYEISSIEGMDGMKILPSKSSVIFNASSIVLLTSRVNEKKLILDNDIISKDTLDICNKESLTSRGIDDQFIVIGTFSFTYEGNHTFSRPKRINQVTLGDYQKTNHYC